MSQWFSVIATITSLIGTFIGLRAATVPVRDNLDAFMDDIKRQSRWNTRTALAGCIAGLLNAVVLLRL